MKNSGLFLNMENCVFGFLFFEALYLLWFVFCVSTIKALKNVCFPQFFGFFLGWLLLLYLGLEGLYVLVFSVFGLLFGVGLVFFFGFVLFCAWMLLFLSLFFWFVFFLLFVFFGGFKGQVRWPEGPPHLALNPPYFLFLFFFFFFFLFFLFLFFSLSFLAFF